MALAETWTCYASFADSLADSPVNKRVRIELRADLHSLSTRSFARSTSEAIASIVNVVVVVSENLSKPSDCLGTVAHWVEVN